MLYSLFIVGALIAGFIQGLTGFAFALIAMSFWIWALPPQLAAPLVVFASVWCHIISMLQEKTSLQLSRKIVLPYMLAGLVAVPLGTYLLDLVNAQAFRLTLGIFLLLWTPMMLINPKIQALQKSGRIADSIIGFLAGILGGLGGFCGALPSAWVMLKQLPKLEQRYILRHFNFAIQVFTLTVYLIQGTLSSTHLPYIAVLLLTVSLPAILGARLFYQISEQRFKQVVLGLLFSSGLFLTMTSLRNML